MSTTGWLDEMINVIAHATLAGSDPPFPYINQAQRWWHPLDMSKTVT